MARRPGYNTPFPGTQVNAPAQYRAVVPGTTPQAAQISQYAGMPVGMETLTRWYIKSYDFSSANTLPGALTPSEGLSWVVSGTGAVTISHDLIFPRAILTNSGVDTEFTTMQVAHATSASEIIRLGAGREQYFRATIAITDTNDALSTVTDVEWFLGFALTDTTLFAGNSDYIGFHKPDGSTSLNFVMGKAGSTIGADFSQATGTTLTADDAGPNAFMSMEFRIFDSTNVMAWVNNEHALTINETTEMPDSANICLTVGLLNGEAVAKIMHIPQLIIGQKYP